MKIFFNLILFILLLNACSVLKKPNPYGLDSETKKQRDISYELKRLSDNYEKSIKNKNK